MNTAHLFGEAKRLAPSDQATYVSAGLPAALAGSPVSVWQPSSSGSSLGRRVVLGIATHSLPDLELLDALAVTLSERHHNHGDLVEVFDVVTCTNMKDFEDRIPGIGEVFQTPVVGIWENGVLIQQGSGARARQIISERFLSGGKNL
jgi:hypothetical protein